MGASHEDVLGSTQHHRVSLDPCRPGGSDASEQVLR